MSAGPVFEPDLFMSEPEYLAFEHASDTKHEFVDGQVYDWPGYDYDAQGMVGARLRHNILQVNLVTSLAQPARAAGCQVVGSDMRLRIGQPSTHRYYYPDVMVLCDEHELHDNDEATDVSRPCVVFEIISARSMRIDHIEKLHAYRAIPSVQAYVIVHQQRRRVERHWRDADDTWHRELLISGSVAVPCVGAELSLDDVYGPIVDPGPDR